MRNVNFFLPHPRVILSLGRALCCFRIVCMVMLLGISLATYAQVTVQIKNTPLRTALKTVEQASNYKFFYNESLVELNQNVSVEVKNGDIDIIMKQLLMGMAIDYKKEQDQVIVLVRKEATSKSLPKSISGTITDISGEAIIGASIQVKGQQSGTITDIDGKFMLADVEENSTLVISYIGYKNIELLASDKRVAKIILQEDTEMIEEVVVVGYGTVKKRDVTTSIASISAKDMENQPVTNVGEAMVGRMPGVQVTQGSGAPGGGLQIRVRGTGTITAGTTPLYVVDGVPMGQNQLNTLNMNDVESIEVLKDASSAAIYGSRGSNGVVIISTKRGKEGKPTVSYSGYVGVQSVAKKIDMLNAYEYAELVRDARNNSYADKMRQINNVRVSKGLDP
ncbi:MAG: TonB-dependent receptor plug domain-containing protein, partial [Phocaeicola sp.]